MIDWKHLRAQVMGKGEKPPLPPRLEIPKMPHTVSAVCERAQKPDCTAADLCEVLEQDPSITVDLLKHVNSAATGLRTKAATVRQAVALLGVKNTRLFVTTTVLEQHMRNTKSPLILGHLFCLSAMERALLRAKSPRRPIAIRISPSPVRSFKTSSCRRLPKCT